MLGRLKPRSRLQDDTDDEDKGQVSGSAEYLPHILSKGSQSLWESKRTKPHSPRSARYAVVTPSKGESLLRFASGNTQLTFAESFAAAEVHKHTGLISFELSLLGQ